MTCGEIWLLITAAVPSIANGTSLLMLTASVSQIIHQSLTPFIQSRTVYASPCSCVSENRGGTFVLTILEPLVSPGMLTVPSCSPAGLASFLFFPYQPDTTCDFAPMMELELVNVLDRALHLSESLLNRFPSVN